VFALSTEARPRSPGWREKLDDAARAAILARLPATPTSLELHKSMCGIVGVVSPLPANQLLYDSLLLLQHRGQDSAGIATADGSRFHMVKARGQVREAFRTRDMRTLQGTMGLGHVRYVTKGSATNEEETQPFYVNAPHGIILVHNGNLTNTRELTAELANIDRRHLNTTSDTELLLNILAHELQAEVKGPGLDADDVFNALSRVHERVEGSYASIALIAGHGLLAFRDPYGIRPLTLGRRISEQTGTEEWIVASESLVMESLGFEIVRDVAPGEAIFIAMDGAMTSRQTAREPRLVPCSFEYVYLARPDSVMNGISVYEARLRMGNRLADTIAQYAPTGDIDVVMPIPDSARPAAMQVAQKLGIEYREGFYKNRYVGRTFIMPGQAQRKKSVRQKLNAMSSEFKGKNVLIVDDSIVRGTTSREIVEMARAAGANEVTFTSAAPPVRYPHVYGINMPSREELIASGRKIPEIAAELSADHLIYQEVDDMFAAITEGSNVTELEMSCFTGEYVTGRVSPEYLAWVEATQLS
jgi:amidophosphoribosyltransferase